ncbi:MAG TPA: type II toxin-antitoxin system prevent-host-death family antitoxin [Clostridiales bacterium]|nr:type II toxin-antitoxin system prevent-host-death family antitoxin [Clostridiales bacterium]
MKIDTKNIVSITEANQNFSSVVKKVETNDEVIVLKNNVPKYVVSKFEDRENMLTDNDAILLVAKMILTEHHKAFEELGK